MSWTITDDGGALQVRATLHRAEEALILIEHLKERYATFKFEGDDTGMVRSKLGFEEKDGDK
jgi:hypothetical protein